MNWTPEQITNLVIQLVALVTAVGGVIAILQGINKKVDVNTAATVATAAKVDEIHAATVAGTPSITAP